MDAGVDEEARAALSEEVRPDDRVFRVDQLARLMALFIFRNLMDGESGKEDVESSLALNIRVSLGTYKIFYEAGKEDFVFRRRTDEDEQMLLGRATAREEERRRSKWLR